MSITEYPACQRCSRPTRAHTMSWFNNQEICMECDDLERQHPKYAEAKEHIYLQEKMGNTSPEGIGLPEDLRIASINAYRKSVGRPIISA